MLLAFRFHGQIAFEPTRVAVPCQTEPNRSEPIGLYIFLYRMHNHNRWIVGVAKVKAMQCFYCLTVIAAWAAN